jgi:uncharacterized protein YfcZ (UPF0381/DUF406 family)
LKRVIDMNEELKKWIEEHGGMNCVEVVICTNTHSVIENEDFYPDDAEADDIIAILSSKARKKGD